MERILKLRQLLKLEREEDFAQYKEHFSRNNINHRKQSGVTWYPIVILNSEIGLGEYINIDVERTSNLNEPHQFSGGKMAAIFSNAMPEASPINGTVKVLGPNKLRLSLNVDDLPDWFDSGKLGINLLFDESGYKEMDIALEKVLLATNSRLAVLRDIFYGLREAEFESILNYTAHPKLNEVQNEAVKKILEARDIALVHGPPGTGKTTTLVQAISEVLRSEKQVLVCSSSNTAVDLLTEKLHKENIKVLRLGNPAKVSEEVLMNTLDSKVAAHVSYKDLKKYRKTAEEYFRMAGKYKRTFGREEREQRQLLYQEARKILAEARVLEDFITHEQFSNAQVIACTPVVSASRHMRDKQFSTLFMDEAAQALEPMSWIPISRSNRVIFAGDHFQLPPTVKSKKAEAEGLAETLFERCMQLPGVSIMLERQYRMHEQIMHYSNQTFYGGNLIADALVRNHHLGINLDDEKVNAALNFIDTAGCSYDEQLNPESLSICNPDEAVLLLKHLKLLLAHYFKSEGALPGLTVGIISPYKEQVNYINLLLDSDEELKSYPAKIVVKTVDGFQGQERSVIYISLVRSNSTGEIGFLNDIRRMNVALTRAQKKLVVIGDSATLAKYPFYKNFIDYAEEINSYQSAWEFLGD